MSEVNHFTHGWVTPLLSYSVAFLGSLLGLTCTTWARESTERRRRAWLLALAAFAIGGTAIWVMHYLAMIGFSVPDTILLYDVGTTIRSFFIAVVMVGIGLFTVGLGKPAIYKVLLGGPVTGVGVAFMHYTGMSAMRMKDVLTYDSTLVVASYVIAVVAATVALWFTVVIRSRVATIGAAAVMAVAVCGMHYTGMAAIRVVPDGYEGAVKGVEVTWFVVPIAVFSLLAVVALAGALKALPSTTARRPVTEVSPVGPATAPAASAGQTGPRSDLINTAGTGRALGQLAANVRLHGQSGGSNDAGPDDRPGSGNTAPDGTRRGSRSEPFDSTNRHGSRL